VNYIPGPLPSGIDQRIGAYLRQELRRIANAHIGHTQGPQHFPYEKQSLSSGSAWFRVARCTDPTVGGFCEVTLTGQEDDSPTIFWGCHIRCVTINSGTRYLLEAYKDTNNTGYILQTVRVASNGGEIYLEVQTPSAQNTMMKLGQFRGVGWEPINFEPESSDTLITSISMTTRGYRLRCSDDIQFSTAVDFEVTAADILLSAATLNLSGSGVNAFNLGGSSGVLQHHYSGNIADDGSWSVDLGDNYGLIFAVTNHNSTSMTAAFVTTTQTPQEIFTGSLAVWGAGSNPDTDTKMNYWKSDSTTLNVKNRLGSTRTVTILAFTR